MPQWGVWEGLSFMERWAADPYALACSSFWCLEGLQVHAA